jgi:hypothetical protein
VCGTRRPALRENPRAGAVSAGLAETDGPEVEVESFATSRVIFFSDAVLAIAITLLALGLPLPHSTGSTTNHQMLNLLADNRDSYLAFVVSFAVIGNHWTAHRRVFRYVTRVNHRVGQLTVLWLLMMVLTPFAAKLLAGSGGFGALWAVIPLLIRAIRWRQAGGTPRQLLTRIRLAVRIRRPGNRGRPGRT